MQTLPIVDKMRRSIDEVFLRFVGPIGAQDAAAVYEEWRKTCKRLGPSGLHEYIQMLSVHIMDTQRREQFKKLARKAISLRQ